MLDKSKSPRADRWILYGKSLIILGLIVMGVESQHMMLEIHNSTSRRAHARKVALEIQKIHLLVEQAETGRRGYLLTGKEIYLGVYQRATDRLSEQFELISRMISEQPDQLNRLKKVQTLVASNLEEIRYTIDLKRAGQMAKAVAIMANGKGQSQLNKSREFLAEMDSVQTTLIDEHNDSTQRIMRNSSAMVLFGSLVAVIFGIFSAYILRRNQKLRTLAQDDLRRSNASLEKQKSQLSNIVATQQKLSTSSLDKERIMQLVVEHAQSLSGADGSIIEIIEGDEMVYYHASGNASQFIGMRIKKDSSFSGLCVREGVSLVCADSELDNRVDREACRRVNVRSMIVTPLQYEGATAGVLKCYSAMPNHFSDQDVKTVELVAGILASSWGRAVAQAELIVARDYAQAATRAKAQFLANMSHEIRTPLNGILGMARLIADTPLDREQQEFVHSIEAAGQGLLKLVNDILDISKVDAGKLEFESIDFDLNSTIRDLTRTFQLAWKEKGLQLVVEVDTQLPAYLKGDPGRLRQILLNLIGNSIKFTEHGFIKLAVHQLNEENGRVNVRFEVHDSGIGISEEVRAKLFTEFVQGDVSTTRKFGGTGLGLSICKRLVEQMCGRIGVESQRGKGTTFWFEVSLECGHHLAEAKDQNSPLDLKLTNFDWRILVVEDNALNQVIAVRSLQKFGLRADVAINGLEALQVLKNKSYDLIFMDCHMPEMDGYETTQSIRKGGLAVPTSVTIVAMTANALADERERCLGAGMDDYLAKPFTMQNLAGILHKWLQDKKSA